MRDQEVRRATRELAAYFKGLRTEREARAALKIIKAFIRARERQDPRRRAPLPGLSESPRQPNAGAGRRKPKPPRRAEPPSAAPPHNDGENS
jgi:hypothetical protein